MRSFDFIAIALGMRSLTMNFGGAGSSGPTLQQQQLDTEQALTTANLNLEENSQRKSILNAMLGTRVFRGSALSRAVRGNTPGTGGEQNAPAPSVSQTGTGSGAPIVPFGGSLVDENTRAAARASTSATTASVAGGIGAGGGYAGGGGRGGGAGRGVAP